MGRGGSGTARRSRSLLAGLILCALALELLAAAPSSALVPLLPQQIRVPGWLARGAALLSLDRASRPQLASLSVAVLAIDGALFLLTVREARRGRASRWAIGATTLVVLGLSVAGPLLLSRDAYSYALYGRIRSVYHANPYVRPPSAFPSDPFAPVISPRWAHTRSVYGPAFTLASAVITRAEKESPAATITAFKLLAGASVAGAAALAGVAVRLLGRSREVDPAVHGWTEGGAMAVVGLNPVIVFHTVGGAHNDAWVAFLLAAALVLALEAAGQARRGAVPEGGVGKPRSPRPTSPSAMGATALLALASLVKVPAAIPLAVWWWSLVRGAPLRRRGRVVAAHLLVAATVATAVTVPLYSGWRTLSGLGTLASVEGWASGSRLVARGVEGLLQALGAQGAALAGGRVVYGLFLATALVILWRILHSATPQRSGHSWGAAMIAFALAAPYLLPWYAAWFVVFLPLVSDPVLQRAGLATSLALALTGVPAEPGTAPGVWRAMVLAVHYGAAPLMLAMFALVATRLLARGGQAGTGPTVPQPAGTMAT